MTWVKIDDGFPDHPKVFGLSDAAFRVHISALCYAGKYLTDGFIPMALASRFSNGKMKVIVELTDAGLWDTEIENNGFRIHDYLVHQSSKEQVESEKKANRERVKRYQERKTGETNGDTNGISNGISNEFLMEPDTEYRVQIQSTDTDINTTSEIAIAIPRVKSAQIAVTKIGTRLQEARENGINAWNLSKLVEDEWDILHQSNDIGGCIALTAWYISELQSRNLTSAEISRIGQMTKRFGRIALLAIDEAASKDLTDLVSYAFRVAQNLYKERKA